MKSMTNPQFLERIWKIPFLRLTLYLLTGILFEYHVGLGDKIIWGIIPITVLVFVSLIPHKRPTIIWGIVFLIFFFLLGCILIQKQQKQSSLPLNTESYYLLTINRKPEKRTKSIRSEIIINAYLDSSNIWRKCKEKAYIYFDSTNISLSPGSVYACKTEFNEINKPRNPYEFNYQQYLAQRGIFASSFINANKLLLVKTGALPFYRKFPLLAQTWVESVYSRAGLKEREFAVVAALTCGNREYLDKELEQAYSTAGVIHLLAVSGLHVGIIFAVLNFLFSFLQYGRFNKFIRFILLLIFLWFYALLTGFSPSIVRACFMFSLIILGDLITKPSNTYNNIAFSAFVICLINPYSIFDLSFLLSYSAVLGIVFFQKRIYAIWQIKNKFLSYVWSLATVSIAAQLTTLPIIIYYFHQFPFYFLIANLLLVPLCTFVMYAAVTLLFVSLFPFLFKIVGLVLQLLLELLNKLVLFFESLPGALISNIYIDQAQTLLIVVAIFASALYFLFHQLKYIKIVLVSFIGISVISVYHQYSIRNQYKLGVVNARNADYIYCLHGRTGWRLLDSASATRNFDFNTKNFLLKAGFNGEENLKLITCADSLPNYYKGVLIFKGKRIGIADKLLVHKNYKQETFTLDFLFVNVPFRRAESLLKCYSPSSLIFSGKLNPQQKKLWEYLNIPVCDGSTIN